MCVYCMHACHHAQVEIRGQLVEVDSPHHMGPEIKLRMSGLVVSTFTC